MVNTSKKVLGYFLIIVTAFSLLGNLYAVNRIKIMTERQNYSLFQVYTEASRKLNEGFNIICDQITQVENNDNVSSESFKPYLHQAYNNISIAHSLIDSCQYLNEDFNLSISSFAEYMRILSVQNDFQPEYDLAKLSELVAIYETLAKDGPLNLELPRGYSIGSVKEIALKNELEHSMMLIESVSKDALDYHLKKQ